MSLGMGWLRWLAPVVAVAAVVFLPALQLEAPILGTAQWTVAQLGADAVHALRPRPASQPSASPSLSTLLHQVQQLRQQFGGGSGASRLDWALAAAGLIPMMALLAGLCALLSLLWQACRFLKLAKATALVGFLTTVYSVTAGWWLTRLLRAHLADIVTRTQHSLGGLLHGLQLSTALVGPVGFEAQAGLYVLLLAFAAMLLLPAE